MGDSVCLVVWFQTLEKNEDMAVSLIREEWLLDPPQKSLNKDDRPENYRHMFSLGKEIFGSPFFFLIF